MNDRNGFYFGVRKESPIYCMSQELRTSRTDNFLSAASLGQGCNLYSPDNLKRSYLEVLNRDNNNWRRMHHLPLIRGNKNRHGYYAHHPRKLLMLDEVWELSEMKKLD